jgi:ATP-dependent RNA helicase RhlE
METLKTFEDLDLNPAILQALIEEGYVTPTPIQSGAVPPALEGHDVLGVAQTGTGKTAAFTIPILHRLATETFSRDPRALILTPTRELAMQIEEFVCAYGRNLKLRSVCIVGGMPMGAQIRALRAGCDIAIATPGRLLDLLHQREIQLSHVEILVLDEADRMLDMGFIPDVRHILRTVPSRRQTLLFSATMPPEINRLAQDFLREPVRVEVAPSSTPVEKVRQVLHPVDHHKKTDLLHHLLTTQNWEQVLVFTRTKRAVEMVHKKLNDAGVVVDMIHGDMHQKARLRALEAFKGREVRVLIATDVASRGLDIENISHVVNFDMPDTIEDYIHRIGRTARASADGDAVSFIAVEDWDVVKELERAIGSTLPRVEVPGFEPTICRFLAVPPEDKKPVVRRRLLRGGRRR